MSSQACAASYPRTATPRARSPKQFSSLPGYGEFDSVIRSLHASSSVRSRHLVFPLEDYAQLTDFGELNDLFIEHAVELGCAAVSAALDEAGLAAKGRRPDHDHDGHRRCSAAAGRPHRRDGWACALTCGGCRSSDWAASPGQRGWLG